MSLLPLNLPIGLALSFYQLEVAVKDALYTTTDGEDKQAYFEARFIQACIDPGGGQRLEQMFGGSVSDGDIAIFTQETLFMVDMYDEGAQQKQSFVLYSGLNYRVAELSDWTPQAGVNVYLGKRHVRQDVI